MSSEVLGRIQPQGSGKEGVGKSLSGLQSHKKAGAEQRLLSYLLTAL